MIGAVDQKYGLSNTVTTGLGPHRWEPAGAGTACAESSSNRSVMAHVKVWKEAREAGGEIWG